jgi:hypothetical protein
MAFHDTACVPPPPGGRQAVPAGPGPAPGETGSPPVRSIHPLRPVAGPARKERVRAILEMQVRPEETKAGARILSWDPRRKRAPDGNPSSRKAAPRELRSGGI